MQRRRAMWGLIILLTAGSLAACSVSFTGGIIGLVVSVCIGVAVLLGASTQQGCGDDPDIGPCLGAPYEDTAVPPSDASNLQEVEAGTVDEPDIGPCLGAIVVDAEGTADADVHLGPCLSAPAPTPDAVPVEPDADIGPCLSVEPPEDVGPPDEADAPVAPDAPVGPCLSVQPPEADTATDLEDAEVIDETEFGPCLSPPAPDPPDVQGGEQEDVSAAAPAEPTSRAAIIERLGDRGVLPPDVLERLSEKEKS
ncbi:MAG: hypothetical protein QF464_00775 [Myxococcota bacterium]|nr:hypothetical protein [Myxococcota bacterium]